MPILFIKHINRSFLLTQNLRLNKLKNCKMQIFENKISFIQVGNDVFCCCGEISVDLNGKVSLVSNIGGKQEKVSLLVNSEEVFVFTKVIETKTWDSAF